MSQGARSLTSGSFDGMAQNRGTISLTLDTPSFVRASFGVGAPRDPFNINRGYSRVDIAVEITWADGGSASFLYPVKYFDGLSLEFEDVAEIEVKFQTVSFYADYTTCKLSYQPNRYGE